VIDRSELPRKVAEDRLLEGDDRRPDVQNCYAVELGADAVVEGFLDDVSKGITLRIKTWRVGDRKVIFEKGITLTLTPEMKALAAKPVFHPQAAPLSGKNTWVKPQHPPVADVAATPVPKCCDKGYTTPSCLYCPHPDFPPAATAGKEQGAILLDVQIDTDGFPAKISVFQGLPCGLNQSAIDTVKKWKFTPATGPDEKAVTVRQMVEGQFRLY
jgi:TonB family protein